MLGLTFLGPTLVMSVWGLHDYTVCNNILSHCALNFIQSTI